MKKTINIAGKIVSLENPLIMGIINVTPDSFHKDSRYSPFEEDFLKKANEMVTNGADILDIGGYSTRPHAEEVSVKDLNVAANLLSQHIHNQQVTVSFFSLDSVNLKRYNSNDLLKIANGFK